MRSLREQLAATLTELETVRGAADALAGAGATKDGAIAALNRRAAELGAQLAEVRRIFAPRTFFQAFLPRITAIRTVLRTTCATIWSAVCNAPAWPAPTRWRLCNPPRHRKPSTHARR